MGQAKRGKVGQIQASFVVRDSRTGRFAETKSTLTTLPGGKTVREVKRDLFDRAVAAAIREKK